MRQRLQTKVEAEIALRGCDFFNISHGSMLKEKDLRLTKWLEVNKATNSQDAVAQVKTKSG
jgi:hypothetical protein